MEKWLECIYLFPSVLYFALQIKFRPGQECTKCDQTAALNKNAGNFITLSIFLTLHVYNSYFIQIVLFLPKYLARQNGEIGFLTKLFFLTTTDK